MYSGTQRSLHAIRGLYGLADAGGTHGDPVRVGAALLDGGCRLIQLRCKGWSDDEVVRAGRELSARTPSTQATLIVNDRPHLVEPIGAQGVHVGQLDLSTRLARAQMPPGSLLGRSTHAEEHVLQALEDADYLAFGPIWATRNTDRDKGERGLAALKRVRTLVPSTVPLVAIGSITAERVPSVQRAGADAWAVIGAVRDAADPLAATRSLLRAALP